MARKPTVCESEVRAVGGRGRPGCSPAFTCVNSKNDGWALCVPLVPTRKPGVVVENKHIYTDSRIPYPARQDLLSLL